MFLLVTPAGGKLWRLKYRIDGKEKLLAIGSLSSRPASAMPASGVRKRGRCDSERERLEEAEETFIWRGGR
jgi:hypothetical protein